MDIVYKQNGFKRKFSRFLIYKINNHVICLKKNNKYVLRILFLISKSNLGIYLPMQCAKGPFFDAVKQANKNMHFVLLLALNISYNVWKPVSQDPTKTQDYIFRLFPYALSTLCYIFT